LTALDGNAIAGALFEAFGGEMTMVTGVCASCGASGPVAEFVVYVQAPGIVARCRRCDAVLMVLVTKGGVMCLDLRGLDSLGPMPDPEAG
jgi:Family of unknown function (DUF6510)